MPLYDYRCVGGHVTEAKRGREVVSIPCPACKRQAARQAVYQEQYIAGETVAKGVPRALR